MEDATMVSRPTVWRGHEGLLYLTGVGSLTFLADFNDKAEALRLLPLVRSTLQ